MFRYKAAGALQLPFWDNSGMDTFEKKHELQKYAFKFVIHEKKL
jgi:hypothetical protein